MKLSKKEIKTFLFLFVYSFFLLLVLSPDSYLRDVYHRCDTAWFFMCGKAWMSGMIPYVDFADSKGPLLWLVYGCGYLIHHYSYVGVFWMSSLFYAVSFWFAFKLSLMYVNRNGAIVILALLSIALFWHNFHNEVRAEDFCYPFVFGGLYSVCRVLKGVDKRSLVRLSFLMGVCMMGCLLIKWSVTLMMSGLAFVLLYSSFRKKMYEGLYGGVIGMFAMFLPFLIYFLFKGNLGAFVTEYFCNTYSTVSKPFIEMLSSYLQGWMHLQKPFILFLVGLVLFCRKLKVSYWLLFGYFTFLSLAIIAPYPHYWSILLPFSIFLFILLIRYIEYRICIGLLGTLAISVVIVCLGMCLNIHSDISFVFQKDVKRQNYYDVSQLMSLTKNPKVMFNDQEHGVGILADALPACKYWARQTGASSFMDEEREKALNVRRPDFIVNSEFVQPQYAISSASLEKLGYVYCGMAMGISSENRVYCKKELYRKLPHVQIRTIDLLMKKNLFKEK